MKKVLLSLFMAFVCLPIAFGQAFDRPIVTTSQTACDSYTWPVDSVTYYGDTTVLIISDTAVYLLDLTILSASGDTTDVVDSAACVYHWRDSVWTTPGVHIGKVNVPNGCDSIYRITLYLSLVDSSNINTVVCDSFPAPWGGMLTESLVCDSTWTTGDGCQRHDVINLTVGHTYLSPIEVIDTDDCFIRWNGLNITDTAVHSIRKYTTVGHCDSLLRVKVNLSFHKYDSAEIVRCGSYTFYGENLTTSGTYTHNDTANNCVTSHILNLTINPAYYSTPTTVTDVTAGCFYKFAGITYTDTNEVHTDTVKTAEGCDSIASIRIVAYTGEEYDNLDTAYCGTSFNWRGQGRTAVGHYYDTTVTATCTTYHHLNLSFTHRHETKAAVTRCATYTFKFGGQRAGLGYGAADSAVFTESGVYTTDTTYNDPLFPDSNLYIKNPSTGCITFLTLPLTIVQPEQRYRDTVTVVNACDKYTFRVGGSSGASSGILTSDTTGYELRYENHHPSRITPCYDSIGILDLTIHHSTNIDTTVLACDSFYWAFSDSSFYSTQDYRKVMTDTVNEDGCPIYGRLNLTVHYTPNVYIDGNWMLAPGESTELTAVCTTPNVNFQWYTNGQEYSTDTTITVNDPQNGQNVNVQLVTKVRNQNCPANNWVIVTFNNAGIENADEVAVDIYPNPTSRILNLRCAEAINRVTIYNAIGQQVLLSNGNGNAMQLDLGNLVGGTYTMHIGTADGNKAIRKLIVSK